MREVDDRQRQLDVRRHLHRTMVLYDDARGQDVVAPTDLRYHPFQRCDVQRTMDAEREGQVQRCGIRPQLLHEPESVLRRRQRSGLVWIVRWNRRQRRRGGGRGLQHRKQLVLALAKLTLQFRCHRALGR